MHGHSGAYFTPSELVDSTYPHYMCTVRQIVTSITILAIRAIQLDHQCCRECGEPEVSFTGM